jgi:serine/threonine-protein kinase
MGAAKAAIALASMRAWFVPGLDPSVDWETVAQKNVERALRDAPDVAESHIAAAHYALQRGSFRDAVAELTKAIDIAPTYAGAHAALGAIEVEAGRPQQGVKRLALAHELDPTSLFPLIDLVRTTALQGKWDEVATLMESLGTKPHPALMNLRLRFAIWRGRADEVMRVREDAKHSDMPIAQFTVLAAGAYLQAPSGEELVQQLDAVTPKNMSPRFQSLFHQIAAELLASIDEPELAAEAIAKGADGAMIDLEWLEKCPALTKVRPLPLFAEALKKVRARVSMIWVA